MEVIFTQEEIPAVAQQLMPLMSKHAVIGFCGEMGAGKTTFIRTLCKLKGIKEMVSSPTFSIINQYKTQDGQIIYHIDLFRIKDENEAIQAGVEDCLFSGSSCLVEWPEKVPGIFPDNTLYIQIVPVDLNTRKLNINL